MAATLLAAAVCALLAAGAWRLTAWWLAGIVPVAVVWGWVIAFFRDPRRTPPDEDGTFVSPADGRVADVTPVGPDSPLGRDGLRVGVFMSIFSVHVNRSPCDGRVRSVEHHDGAFLDVRRPEAYERNESATIHMTISHAGREHPVVVRQVAGLVARRIVTDLTDGQDVRKGQVIGMIKFGSRLELMVPRELVGEVRVRVGDRVAAGLSILLAAPKGPADANRQQPRG